MNEIDEWFGTTRFAGEPLVSTDELADFQLGALARTKLAEQAFDERCTELFQNAISAQSSAMSYLLTARRLVATARTAWRTAQPGRYAMHLRQARDAHDQARKCLGFARLCRQRADRIAAAGDAPTAKAGPTGHGATRWESAQQVAGE